MEPVSQPPGVDEAVYRNVVGRFPTGVTVVSARTPQGVRLMTANSLTSVSLEPLLVLVCIQLSARFHTAVTTAGEWAVSVLAADQERLARIFAGRYGAADLQSVPHRLGPATGAPLLDGAVSQLECRTVASYPGGDHTILLGAVLEGAVTREGVSPLVFYRGGYGSLSP
ncbi:MAG: flavin reductase family protein [Mycobacteriales bacterium]